MPRACSTGSHGAAMSANCSNLIYRAALLAREDEIDAGTIAGLLDDRAVASDGEPTVWPKAISPLAGRRRSLPDGDALSTAHWPNWSARCSATRYARTGGNQLKAAQLLGINRNTLRKRLARTGHRSGAIRPG